MFIYLDLLTIEQCCGLLPTIYSFEKQWISRSSSDFFTLGVATYLDMLNSSFPQFDYFGRLPVYNSLLLTNFSYLFDALRERLQKYLGEPVKYTRDFALPGFHIFLSRSLAKSEQEAASVHFDTQYQGLPWSTQWDDVPPISFTIPIALPKTGGGLDLWNITNVELVSAYHRGLVESVDKYKERTIKIFYPYSLGKIFLHKGIFLHRIAPTPKKDPDDIRITLQGHGLRFKGEWILYW